jgi:hypothetical protein
MFLTSPRNSTAAHESLFKRLNCTKVLAPVLQPTPVESILSTCKAQLYDVPSVEELLGTRYRHFELSKTYPEAADQPLLIVYVLRQTFKLLSAEQSQAYLRLYWHSETNHMDSRVCGQEYAPGQPGAAARVREHGSMDQGQKSLSGSSSSPYQPKLYYRTSRDRS